MLSKVLDGVMINLVKFGLIILIIVVDYVINMMMVLNIFIIVYNVVNSMMNMMGVYDLIIKIVGVL